MDIRGQSQFILTKSRKAYSKNLNCYILLFTSQSADSALKAGVLVKLELIRSETQNTKLSIGGIFYSIKPLAEQNIIVRENQE